VWFTEFNGDALDELVPAPLEDGPTVGLSPQSISMSASDQRSVEVTTSLLTSSPRNSEVDLSVAGVTRSGVLENLTAAFDTNPATVPSGGTGSENLTLVSRGLKPGTYYLTVTARAAGGNVTEGVLLKVTVFGYEDQFRAALLDGLLVGAAASVAVIGVLLLRRSRLKTMVRK
jgi:hypothetical protein